MKLSMSSLDIMVCARELKNTIGFQVDNVYESNGMILLRLRSPKEGRRDLVLELGRRVNLTKKAYRVPKQPSSFAQLLRKHLKHTQLSTVEQPDFERILELKFSNHEERLLILELFGRGNLVLCNPQRNIIQPYRVERWRHRTLKAGDRYAYPPRRVDSLELRDVPALHRAFEGAPDLVRGLAINLNLGGSLAEEICARASVPKSRKPKELSEQEGNAILNSMKDLLTQELAPNIVYDDKKPVDVVPFDFKIHCGKRVKRFGSFNEALDEYFNALAVASAAEKQKKRFERELDRLRKRQMEQEARFADLYEKSVESKRKADLVAIHHTMINEVLKRLDGLRRRKEWQAVIDEVEKAKTAGDPWAELVRKIDPSAAKLELELVGQRIVLDLRVSAFENASQLYGQYKRLAEKAAGAKEALNQTTRELEKLINIGVPEIEIPPPVKPRKPKWFERYRWFISSDGMIVIGGRDAKTNAEVVDKHMEPNDRHLHADIVGAPHVVIKTGGRDVPETTLREAAEFAAMHSRAWRGGLGSLDVYWVMPKQVSKQAPSGTYLPKGSYVIEGKRNLLKVPIKAAIGILTLDGEQVVTCGPLSAVQKHSRVVIELSPGGLKKSDLARQIQGKFKADGIEVSIEEIERALPPGKGEIKR
ncbi:MAG: ribosome rescue protein RqcH [Hadesarchaea archaeon]|nr:ribosome rescue protein RqcH [Hadesarchaea archaeon]